MNKVVLLGALAAVGVAGYVGGVAYTGEQVNKQFDYQLAQLNTVYAGQAKFSASGKPGMFGGDIQLVVEMLGMPESYLQWAGSSNVLLDVNFSHGFFKSTSLMTLADSQLKTALSEYQANSAEQFITNTATYSYDLGSQQVAIDSLMTLAALKIADPDFPEEVFTVAPSTGSMTLLGNEFSVDLGLGDIKGEFSDSNFSVEGIKITESGTFVPGQMSMTTAFDMLLSAQNVSITSAADELTISNFKVVADQQTESDRTRFGVQYAADDVQINVAGQDQPVNLKPNLEMLLDVDFAALVRLIEQVNEMSASDPQQLENPFVMIGLFSELTRQGLGLEVTDLSVAMQGNQIAAKADMDLEPFEIQEVMAEQLVLLDKMDLDAQVVIPNEFLQTMASLDSEFDPSIMQFAVFQGVLVEDEQGFRGDFKVKDGVVTLNGVELPL